MQQAPDRQPKPERGLAVPIAAALAVKLAALAIIYLMFFAPATPRLPQTDRASMAIFGVR